jgi:hypothetical protein
MVCCEYVSLFIYLSAHRALHVYSSDPYPYPEKHDSIGGFLCVYLLFILQLACA